MNSRSGMMQQTDSSSSDSSQENKISANEQAAIDVISNTNDSPLSNVSTFFTASTISSNNTYFSAQGVTNGDCSAEYPTVVQSNDCCQQPQRSNGTTKCNDPKNSCPKTTPSGICDDVRLADGEYFDIGHTKRQAHHANKLEMNGAQPPANIVGDVGRNKHAVRGGESGTITLCTLLGMANDLAHTLLSQLTDLDTDPGLSVPATAQEAMNDNGLLLDFGAGMHSGVFSITNRVLNQTNMQLYFSQMHSHDIATFNSQPTQTLEVCGGVVVPSSSHNLLYEEIKDALSEALGEVLDTSNRGEPILGVGMDSRKALECHRLLENHLNMTLPATVMYDYPSIASLGQFIIAMKTPSDVAAIEGNQDTLCGSDQYAPIRIKSISFCIPAWDNAHGQSTIPLMDSTCAVPFVRWDHEILVNDQVSSGVPSRFGGFTVDVDLFDAQVFRCTQPEATLMDPQQRVLLERSWDALCVSEHQVQSLPTNAGSVYVGCFFQEYASRMLLCEGSLQTSSFAAPSISASVASGRISYTYGLKGPSMTVQTACSSSLVATHLACESMGPSANRSSFSLAAGVNLLLDPSATAMFSYASMLAADGRCKALDTRADGYVRAEASIVLNMSCQDEDFDQAARGLVCCILGTCVNQDGRSTSLTGINPIIFYGLVLSGYE